MERSGRDEFWTEKAARLTGLTRLVGDADSDEQRLPGGAGPYLFVTAIVLVDTVVLPAVGYLRTGVFLTLVNPGDMILLPAWLLVIWSTLRLKKRYESTVAELPDPHTELQDESRSEDHLRRPIIERLFPIEQHRDFETFFPRRQKLLLLFAGWSFHVGWIVTDPTAGQFVSSQAGTLVATLKFGVIYPLFYYPFGVEFLTVFLVIHILLPYKIIQQKRINFQDLRGYGGLRPVGRLSKTSTLHYLLLLSLYVGFVTLSRGVSMTEGSHLLFVGGGMLFGLTLFFFPVVWIGLYMQSQKHAKISRIASDIRDIGQDDSTFPETRAASTDNASKYTHEFARLTVVKDMKDYPIDVFTIRDFLYALPAPILINIFTSYLTSNVLPL